MQAPKNAALNRPKANKSPAYSPARGMRALAASAAVSIWNPALKIVVATATMTKKEIMLVLMHPKMTSHFAIS